MDQSNNKMEIPFPHEDIKESGLSTAMLFAQVTLFVTSLFLNRTTFVSKHDVGGIKTALVYHISALLLPYLPRLSQLKFLQHSCGGLKVNLIMSWAFLLLTIPLENLYEKSWASLGVVLSVAVLVLLLMPHNDFGFFDFLLGAAVSIALNLHQVGYQTWVVVAICIVLSGFKFLLVQTCTNLLRTREMRVISKPAIIEALLVPVFYLYWDRHLLRTNCSAVSCSKTCLFGFAMCMVILVFWFISCLVRVLEFMCVIVPKLLGWFFSVIFDHVLEAVVEQASKGLENWFKDLGNRLERSIEAAFNS